MHVALESTVIAHGLPYPQNVEMALKMENVVREAGAEPRTVGLIGGEPIIGLSPSQIQHLGRAEEVRKVSWRDLPVVVARGEDGATTVAATMWLAQQAGIEVFSTGGIGGVHRSAGETFDVSADMEALSRVPMVVVCAGAKAILDLSATREMLETRGVTVVGYGTDEMPAFYSRKSGLAVDARCDTPEEVVAIVRARKHLGLPGATLVTVPVPAEDELPVDRLEPAVEQALAEANERGLHAARLTPFLLDRVSTLTGERALRANLALLKNNAGIAAQIALALKHKSS